MSVAYVLEGAGYWEQAWARLRGARVTQGMVLLCAALFLGVNAGGGWGDETFRAWGYASGDDFWFHHRLWKAITTNLLHLDGGHFLANALGLTALGPAVEARLGRGRFLLFLLAAAFASTSLELAVNDKPGLGASGLTYALFAYAWLRRRATPELAASAPPEVFIVSLTWLVACFVWLPEHIANFGHLGGLFAGVVWAVSEKPAPRALFAAAMVLPLFFAPWSSTWWLWRAYAAEVQGDREGALSRYESSARLDPRQAWAWYRLSLLRTAYGDAEGGQAALEHLRRLDPALAATVDRESTAASAP